MRMSPLCRWMPTVARSSDDFPAPFGPMRPSHSPVRTEAVKSLTARVRPWRTPTSRYSMELIVRPAGCGAAR